MPRLTQQVLLAIVALGVAVAAGCNPDGLPITNQRAAATDTTSAVDSSSRDRPGKQLTLEAIQEDRNYNMGLRVATIVRSTATWQRLHARYVSGGTYDPEHDTLVKWPAPEVNFTEEMVIVVGLGTTSCVAPSPDLIRSATLHSDTVHVWLGGRPGEDTQEEETSGKENSNDRSSGLCATAIDYMVDMARVKRTDAPVAFAAHYFHVPSNRNLFQDTSRTVAHRRKRQLCQADGGTYERDYDEPVGSCNCRRAALGKAGLSRELPQEQDWRAYARVGHVRFVERRGCVSAQSLCGEIGGEWKQTNPFSRTERDHIPESECTLAESSPFSRRRWDEQSQVCIVDRYRDYNPKCFVEGERVNTFRAVSDTLEAEW